MVILGIIGGLIALGCFRKSRRRKVARRTVTIKTVSPQRMQAQAEAQRKRYEAEQRRIERSRFEVKQAEEDIIHYQQVLADLLKAYDQAKCDGDSEKAIRKRIAYDNSIRKVEKQIETASHKAKRIR